FIRNIMTVGLEMCTEAVHERHKAPADAAKRRWRGCIISPPFFSRMSYLALTSSILSAPHTNLWVESLFKTWKHESNPIVPVGEDPIGKEDKIHAR
ncbi:MAG: hypothetical protein SV775_20060, partial [Thermodesulfobacteriota bacterium]|nr:hypothetical protein [Thermodesulfobacteriota bacterium]